MGGCSCGPNFFHCPHASPDATGFPWPGNTKVEDVLVGGMTVVHLIESHFAKFIHATSLSVVRTGLQVVYDDAFNVNDVLRDLDLSQNDITQLSLPRFGTLRTLNLSYNAKLPLRESQLLGALDLDSLEELEIGFHGTPVSCTLQNAIHPADRVSCSCNIPGECGFVPAHEDGDFVPCALLYQRHYGYAIDVPAWLRDRRARVFYNRICDGVADCPNGVDEHRCQAEGVLTSFEALESATTDSACNFLEVCVGRGLALSTRLGKYYLVGVQDDACLGVRILFSLKHHALYTGAPPAPTVAQRLLNVKRPILHDKARSWSVPTEVWMQLDGDSLVAIVRFSLQINSHLVGPSVCKMAFNLTTADQRPSLPLPEDWTLFSAPAPSSHSRANPVVLVASILAGVSTLSTFVALFLRQRRRSQTRHFGEDTLGRLLDLALQSLVNDTVLEGESTMAAFARPGAAPGIAWNVSYAGGDKEGAHWHTHNEERTTSRASSLAEPVAVDQLLIRPGRLSLGEEIGRGNYGSVHRGRLDKMTTVAVKHFSVLEVSLLRGEGGHDVCRVGHSGRRLVGGGDRLSDGRCVAP
jgi:hypothetical protein